MPPVMGAGAFVMAALLGVPFKTIMIAAVLPALLYYGTVLLMVHLTAVRDVLGAVRMGPSARPGSESGNSTNGAGRTAETQVL